ncbi:MFS transporter [Microbacteriaceae bacterium K1510]|nr:MFS transporter [Microbacteriaceae bacterium K1510]
MFFGFASRLAGLYAAIFVMNGIHLPFFPLWLKAKDLSAGEIGAVLAVPMLIRLLAVPVTTRIADRRDALREAIIAATLLSVGGYLLVALASGFGWILLAFAAASLVFTPVMPLVEAYALKGLSARGRAYGPVRLWGSAAFVLGSFIAGLATDAIATRHLIWLIVAGIVIIAFSAAMLMPLGPRPSGVRDSAPQSGLLRSPMFIAVVLAASFIQASHATYYGFSALAWRAQGYDGMTIAALWGLGVAAEIVLFGLQGRLPAFLTPAMLLIFGAVGGAVRWTAMAFDPPALLLPLLQLLHAASFGASHLGAQMYLARTVPSGQGATAQGYLAIAMGLVMAATTALSGLLYAAYGAASYGAMALAAIAGGVCALIAHRPRHVAAI